MLLITLAMDIRFRLQTAAHIAPSSENLISSKQLRNKTPRNTADSIISNIHGAFLTYMSQLLENKICGERQVTGSP